MGFLAALTLIFIVCKLTEVITWSWIIVLSPIIVEIIIDIIGIVLFFRFAKNRRFRM